MVKPCGALGSTGTFDWLMQRITAIILAVYLFVMVGALAFHPEPMSYSVWVSWFQPTWMKAPTLLAIAALCIHAWIGMWSVATDYLHGMSRCLFLWISGVGLVLCLGWGVMMLWGL